MDLARARMGGDIALSLQRRALAAALAHVVEEVSSACRSRDISRGGSASHRLVRQAAHREDGFKPALQRRDPRRSAFADRVNQQARGGNA